MKEKLVKLGLTEEQAQKVVDNLGTVIDGEYITKTRFNEVNNELKTANDTIKERDGQLEKIKTSDENPETLKQTIADLQAANKQAKIDSDKALATEKKNNTIKLELIGKVHNPDIAMTLLKMDEVVMDENGKVKSGLKEQVDGLEKAHNYLFIPKEKPNSNQNSAFQVKGATPKEGDSGQQTELTPAETMAKTLAVNANANTKKTAESTYFGEQ